MLTPAPTFNAFSAFHGLKMLAKAQVWKRLGFTIGYCDVNKNSTFQSVVTPLREYGKSVTDMKNQSIPLTFPGVAPGFCLFLQMHGQEFNSTGRNYTFDKYWSCESNNELQQELPYLSDVKILYKSLKKYIQEKNLQGMIQGACKSYKLVIQALDARMVHARLLPLKQSNIPKNTAGFLNTLRAMCTSNNDFFHLCAIFKQRAMPYKQGYEDMSSFFRMFGIDWITDFLWLLPLSIIENYLNKKLYLELWIIHTAQKAKSPFTEANRNSIREAREKNEAVNFHTTLHGFQSAYNKVKNVQIMKNNTIPELASLGLKNLPHKMHNALYHKLVKDIVYGIVQFGYNPKVSHFKEDKVLAAYFE
jgi:hypothetical protein